MGNLKDHLQVGHPASSEEEAQFYHRLVYALQAQSSQKLEECRQRQQRLQRQLLQVDRGEIIDGLLETLKTS